MELTLKNIGIIKDSTIKLDGLTVITGPNNSGKSTVGKVLYSLIKTGILPITEYRNEINTTKANSFLKIAEEFRFDTVIKYLSIKDDQFGSIINLLAFLASANRVRGRAPYRENLIDIDFNLEKSYDSLSDFLKEISKEYIIKISKDRSQNEEKYQTYLNSFDERLAKVTLQYKQTQEFISSDDSFRLFVQKSCSRIIKSEFAGQIISNIFLEKTPNLKAKIVLKDGEDILYNLTLDGGGNLNSDFFESKTASFSNVLLIDDSYAVDGLNNRVILQDRYNHNRHLLDCLRNKEDETVFEEEISQENINHILRLIQDSYPGNISNLSGLYMYNDDVIKNLLIQNLATGSKCFAAIKQLIENRQISRNTLLILDEPESHLHPEWQNLFAQIIVLLVKEWNVRILLTTHSPNFLLALDTYAMKNKISDETHFFKSRHNEDYSVAFDCVDEKINEVYADLSLPFIKMDALRSEILSQNIEGDED